jgi:hypothetical protein
MLFLFLFSLAHGSVRGRGRGSLVLVALFALCDGALFNTRPACMAAIYWEVLFLVIIDGHLYT